jgi:oligopeptide/dipeptide ABC transporter ATP-binding protein
VQAQVINLMVDLQEEYGCAYLFIAHDLALVERIADRVAVMYLGRIVETGATAELFRNPLHPYTRALLQAIPVPEPGRPRERAILEGEIPSPTDPPPGCRFHTRCPVAIDVCRRDDPRLREVAPGRRVACHLVPDGPQSAAGPEA